MNVDPLRNTDREKAHSFECELVDVDKQRWLCELKDALLQAGCIRSRTNEGLDTQLIVVYTDDDSSTRVVGKAKRSLSQMPLRVGATSPALFLEVEVFGLEVGWSRAGSDGPQCLVEFVVGWEGQPEHCLC
jgi:hypothetical protein